MEEQNEKKWFEDIKAPERPRGWTLQEGSNYCTVLDEGVEQLEKDYKESDKLVPKRIFLVKVKGEDTPRKWYIKVAPSADSYYMQVVGIAKARGGLSGANLHIYRIGQKLRTRYKVELVNE